MKIVSPLSLIASIYLVISTTVFANSIAYPDSLAFRELLVNKKFDKLNYEITKYQKKYEEDITNEIAFELAFMAFDLHDEMYESLFNEWVEQYPDSYIPILARGHYYEKTGWFRRGTMFSKDTSEKQFEQLYIYLNKALIDINNAITINPDITIIYATKISISKGLNNDELRVEALKNGLNVNPASYEIRKTYLFTILPRWGGSYKEIRDFLSDTKKYEDKNSKLAPLQGFTEYAQGMRLRENDDFKKGVEILTKAISYGDKPWYYYERGLCYFFLKDYDKALSDLNKSVELYPEYRNGLFWRSWAYRKKDMFAEALDDLDLLVSLEPDEFKYIKNRAYVLTKFDQFDEAVEDYKTAVKLDDKNAEMWSYLGWYSNYKLNDYQTAIDAYKKATELNPDNPAYMYHYSVALNNMRDCNMGVTLKKYLKLCKGSNSKYCKAPQIKWANVMINFLKTNQACANTEQTMKAEDEPNTSGPAESTWDKIKEFVKNFY